MLALGLQLQEGDPGLGLIISGGEGRVYQRDLAQLPGPCIQGGLGTPPGLTPTDLLTSYAPKARRSLQTAVPLGNFSLGIAPHRCPLSRATLIQTTSCNSTSSPLLRNGSPWCIFPTIVFIKLNPQHLHPLGVAGRLSMAEMCWNVLRNQPVAL